MFKDGQTVQQMVDGLKSGQISPQNIPAIRVFERDGLQFTLDNRRLLAAQLAGSSIRTVPATESEIAAGAFKFTTPNDGLYIGVRNNPIYL
jgi:hypothetical protein